MAYWNASLGLTNQRALRKNTPLSNRIDSIHEDFAPIWDSSTYTLVSMPFTFEVDSTYGPHTAIINGDLTEADVLELQNIQPTAIAMNGAYGWSGRGLELVGKISSLRNLDLLAYTPANITYIRECTSLEGLYIGANCYGTLDFQGLTALKTLRFSDPKRALKFVGMDDLASLVSIHGNASANMLRMFEQVRSLKSLSIVRPACVDLSWLSSFDLLALEITFATKLVDLAGLATQKNLAYLKFIGNKKFSALEEVSNCASLQYLMIDECGAIKSISPLASIKQLELLSFLGGTNIQDGCISVLDGIEQLDHVRFCDRKHYDKKSNSYTFDMNYFYQVGNHYFSS